MRDSAKAPADSEMLEVFSLAQSPIGDKVIVKTRVPLVSTDGDLSMEIGAAAYFLTSKGYTVYGSFLASDPAASLFNLAGCALIE